MNTEFGDSTTHSSDYYIARAHQLRAQYLRDGFVGLGRGVKRAMHALSARLTRPAHV